MADYKCEELASSCVNFQSAICLHCNRRLCVRHIIEHDNIVFGDVEKLSDLAEVILKQIKDKSEKSRITYEDLLPSFDEWRTQQLEKIEQIYEYELQFIRYKEGALEEFHRDLLQQLERHARQPLQRIQRQQHASTEILNLIRQAIEKVREECAAFNLDFPTSSPISADYPLLKSPSIPVQIQLPKTAESIPVENQSTTNEESSSVLLSKPSTYNAVKLRKGHAFKRLVQMFANISSLEQSKKDIAAYIKNQKHHFKLPILVHSYLTAWSKTSKPLKNTRLLNKHISTIQKYLANRQSDFDVLIGIQIFCFNWVSKKNKSQIMTFLLQFFLRHQCISQSLLVDWYNNNDDHGYMGFQEAQELAKPFIESSSAIDTSQVDIKNQGDDVVCFNQTTIE